jgi:4,5-DOPA dioxygenase extradiol
MTTPQPDTLYDFGGFARELYQLRYPAPGAPAAAEAAGRLLTDAGYSVRYDNERGLDHGVWVPLRYLYPKAIVPVFQVSMPHDLDTRAALRLGQVLAPLRDRGVLILGSGSLTHNLSEFRPHAAGEAPYARAFADWVRDAVLRGDAESLAGYRSLAPQAPRAHPTEDHFLPLLVASGASRAAEPVAVIDGGISYGMLSMDAFAWGI